MTEQIRRIEEAETALNRAQAAVDALEQSWEQYLSVQEDILLLERYLNSEERRSDLEADRSGQLPDELCRGVLSEDGIWNLLEQNTELLRELRQYAAE